MQRGMKAFSGFCKLCLAVAQHWLLCTALLRLAHLFPHFAVLQLSPSYDNILMSRTDEENILEVWETSA